MPAVEHNGNRFAVDNDGFTPGGPRAATDEWIAYQCHNLGLQTMTEEHHDAIDKLWKWHSDIQGKDRCICVRLIPKNMGIKIGKIYQLFPGGPKGFSLIANVKFEGVVY